MNTVCPMYSEMSDIEGRTLTGFRQELSGPPLGVPYQHFVPSNRSVLKTAWRPGAQFLNPRILKDSSLGCILKEAAFGVAGSRLLIHRVLSIDVFVECV